MAVFSIDLDAEYAAARRESEQPETIPLLFKRTTFELPAELPMDALDPFLSDRLDLLGLVKSVVAKGDAGRPSDLVDLIFDRPRLPKDFLDAVKESLALIFGERQWAEFVALRPSVPDYARLVRSLLRVYGVSLGEAFKSPSTSETAGATSNPTSPDTITSTPAPFGGGQDETPATWG